MTDATNANTTQTAGLHSFLDTVITEMSTPSRRSRRNAAGELVMSTDRAGIAKMIQKQSHPNVLNRIAMTYVALSAERRMASRAYKSVQLKPERMLSFVQDLSNAVCWAARRLMLAQAAHEAEAQAAGVDFSADIAEQVGVEGVSTARISDVVDADAFALGNVYSWLAGKMNYLQEIEDFHMYADRGPVDPADPDSPWTVQTFSDTFNGAMAIMGSVLDQLSEEQEAVTGEEAQSYNFGTGEISQAA
jgi:hypothetical protein